MTIATVRDAAIILLAFESLVIGGLIVVLLWQIWRLVALIQTEIKPLLDSANETVNTMRGTTEFVSENVVSPVVKIHSTVAGVKGGLQALFGRKPTSRKPAATRKANADAAEMNTPSDSGFKTTHSTEGDHT